MDVKSALLNGPLDEEVYVAWQVSFVSNAKKERYDVV